jgi:ABC-2 type transport system ATP-binding protein
MTTAVSVRGLLVERGGKAVLPALDLDVPAGAVCGLLGPSGGGKSTLLRSIVGTQVVTGGEVTVLGEPAGSPALRRRVSYMAQAGAVYGDLTAHANLRFFASVLGVPSESVDEVLELVDLSADAHRRVDRMSGGQQARVSLAAALLGDPELLILDEPTVGLDPVLRRSLWSLFRTLAHDQGRTLLVSSHVMDEARHCDRLVLLRDCEVLAEGAPGELLAATGTTEIEDAFLAFVGQGLAP